MASEYVFIPKEEYQRLMSRKPDQVLSAVKTPVTKDTTNKRMGVLGIKRKTPPGEKRLGIDWISY